MIETQSKPAQTEDTTEVVFEDSEALLITGEAPKPSDADTVALSLEAPTFFKQPQIIFSPVTDADTVGNAILHASNFFKDQPPQLTFAKTFEAAFLERSFAESSYHFVPSPADVPDETAAKSIASAPGVAAEESAYCFMVPPSDLGDTSADIVTAPTLTENSMTETAAVAVAETSSQPTVVANPEEVAPAEVAVTADAPSSGVIAVASAEQSEQIPEATHQDVIANLEFAMENRSRVEPSRTGSTPVSGFVQSAPLSTSAGIETQTASGVAASASTRTEQKRAHLQTSAAVPQAASVDMAHVSVPSSTGQQAVASGKTSETASKPAPLRVSENAPSVATTAAAAGQAASAQAARPGANTLKDAENQNEAVAEISGRLFSPSGPDFGANPGDHKDRNGAALILEGIADAEEGQGDVSLDAEDLPPSFIPGDAYVA